MNDRTPSLLPTDRARGRSPAGARLRVEWRIDLPITHGQTDRALGLDAGIEALALTVLIAVVARYSRDETVTLDVATRALEAFGRATAPDAMRRGPEFARVSVDVDRTPASLPECISQTRRAIEDSRTVTDSSAVLFDVGEPDESSTTAEWCLRVSRAGDALALSIDADGWLFDAATLERMSRVFTRMLVAAVSDPDTILMRIDLLEDDERALMLGSWNATGVPRREPQVFHRLFEAQVAATPDATAVESAGRHLSYGELNDQANVLAAKLVARGIGSDTLVGICLDRSPELVVALLAVQKASGAFLPIDPELPQDRVRWMLEESRAALLLVTPATPGRTLAVARRAGTPTLTLVPPAPGRAAAHVPNLPDRSVSSNLAYVIYTSGSSGRPKGVMLPQRALCNHALWFSDRLGMTASDRMLQHASIGFDAAMAEVFAPLVVGATVVLAAPMAHRDLLALPDLLRRERITVVQMVPSALRVVAGVPGFEDCRALRYLVSGGEALEPRLAASVRRALPRTTIGNFYGPTEAAVDATSYEVPSDSGDRATLPIGKPIANARCRILDSSRGLVPVGMPGELCIGGLGLALGYLANPGRTAEVFIEDPFAPGERLYRTGDLARYLPGGDIEYMGRADAQVKLRGYRIELAEVEGPLLQHPEIRQAAVILREDTPGDAQLVAYVVLTANSAVTRTDLRALMRAALPSYMVPSSYCVLDALPLTSSAKLDRRALPAPTPMAPEHPDATPVDDPLERSLQGIWERVLGESPIGLDDDFFALGGQSLKAIRLLAEIEKEHGISLRAPTLFEAPTIRTLATRIRDGSAREVSTLIPVQPRGARPPLFFAPGAGGELFVFDALARALGPDQPLHVLDMYVFDEIELQATPLTLQHVAARMLVDIRKVQPHGPYQLAGYSLGGKIVLEIAQQLRLAGEEVRLLTLLDCDGPAYPLLQPFLTRAAKHLHHALTLPHGDMLPYLRARLGKLSRYVNGPIEEELMLYADQDEAQLVPAQVIEALEQALTPVVQAWEAYQPDYYGGPVLLVRAEVRNNMIGVIDDDPHLGWGPLLGGGITLEHIACDHFDILRPNYAERLAGILRPHLLREEARPLEARFVSEDSSPNCASERLAVAVGY